MKVINNLIKRFFDIVFSFLALVILIPIFLVISLLIKLDSEGNIFFKQNRRTKNGKVFKMYKFRTMVTNAENLGTGLYNYENDPRVTKVGRFLRNTSLDELPQLINVLSGEMSFVGPRPCVTYELGDFNTLNRRYKKRFKVKAGITGYAQIMGRNDISWDEKVKYDNKYIDLFNKYGILIDIKILFFTVLKVFKRENIYEVKKEDVLDDVEAARIMEEEVIRLAHIEDEVENYEV